MIPKRKLTSNKLKKRLAADTVMANSQLWYWAWLVQITLPIENKESAEGDIWENLVMIQASSPEEALAKAEGIGQYYNSDSNSALRLNGMPAVSQFLGIKDIGLIHDGLEDGAEILFRERKGTLSEAGNSVKVREFLIKRLACEVDPYKSL